MASRYRVEVLSACNIGYRDDPSQGMILTTDKGFTLYRRDLDTFPAGRHPGSARLSMPTPRWPHDTEAIRAFICVGKCGSRIYPSSDIRTARLAIGASQFTKWRKQWTYRLCALHLQWRKQEAGDEVGNLILMTSAKRRRNVNNDVGFPSRKAGFNWGVARF